MVKKIFLSVICCTLASCTVYKNAVLIQNNDFLHYLNYSAPVEFGFSFSNFPVTSIFTFNAEKQNNKVPLTGNDSIRIVKIINDFTYKFYEYEKEGFTIDSILTNIFFCGKISVVDGIDSYLFLVEQPDMYYDDISKSFSQELYLINSKNDQITSIVILSAHISGIDIGTTINTYLIDKQYFSQIDYSWSETGLEIFVPQEVINKYFHDSKKREVLYFSTFLIDENGFIQLINVG